VQNAIEAYKQLLLVKASEKKATAAAESLLDLRDQKQKLRAELSELTKQQEELDDKNKNGSNSARGYNYDPNAFLGLIKTEQQLSKIKESIIQTDKAIADADKAIRDSFDFSAEYTSKYGTPETDPYAPPPYTPPPLTGNDKKDVEDTAKKAFEERRAYSDRWIAEQKYYSKLTANEEISAYERIRNYVDQYYRDGVIDYKEYQNQLRDIDKNIFSVRKNMLEEAIDNSIEAEKAGLDARKTALAEEEKSIKDSYDARKKAIEDYYDEIDREEKQQDRTERLKELQKEEEKYENAATREGQDRLKRIRDEIKSINRDIEKEQRNVEKQKKLSEVDAETDKLEADRLRKLEILNEDYSRLDTAQKTILSNISEYAFISAGAIEEVTKKIQTMVQALSNIQIPNGTNTQTAGASSINGGTSISVNDYGPKIINSRDEAIDYTQELFNTALNLK
jgi:chromosome segregation ATPase